MIRKIKREDIPECVKIIKNSFMTVAEEFGFTVENAPRFTAFATTEDRLFWQMDNENRLMFLYEENGIPCGYYSLLMQENCECELNNLAVLPEFRHKGIGKKLLEHAYQTAAEEGCRIINIGIVEENRRLRRWYEENGAVHIGTKKFDFFPFTCGYMQRRDVMEKTFIEMKLFQVKPDKLEQFETKIEEMYAYQLKCEGCTSLKYFKRFYTIDGIELGEPPRELTKIVKCVKYYSYWEFDTKENYGKAIKFFFDNYNKDLQKLLVAPFDINLGYSV